MEEIWNPVTVNGESWPYEVSNRGRVRRSKPHPTGGSTHVGKILKLRLTRDGYSQVGLCKSGQRKSTQVHRLVLEAFKGPCPEGMEANHISGIKDDNRLENLEWVTASRNSRHAFQVGLRSTPRGSENGNGKLTERGILEIRQRLAEGETQRSIAKDYGVRHPAISRIATGKNWGWLV